MTLAPYGSWKSPVTTDLIVAGSIGVSSPCFAGGIQYWAESRPQEGGRIVVVRRDADGSEHDLFAAPFNARTRVHEYGGDAWLIHDGLVYFSNFADQQVHVAGDGEPRPLTHTEGLRFANGVVDARRNRIIYVIEDHRAPGEAVNRIGAVDLVTGDVTMLCEGHDFYSSPALDADAKRLAFIAWDHPNMPWDETLLYVADLDASGLAGEPVCIAGESEALQQPRFAPNGNLVYISDRSGWWNLYEVDADGQHRALCPMEAEFGVPLWAFGASTYDFASNGDIVCLYSANRGTTLARLDRASGELTEIEVPWTAMGSIRVAGETVTLVGASPTSFAMIANVDLAGGDVTEVKCGNTVSLDPGYYSVPEAIEFETAGGDTAHAFYYPPTNKDFEPLPDTLPPLVVILHGGPTAAAGNSLSLSTQFWTSRGFAVLDVNYRGSTGYGRAYRQKLNGQWGVAEVDDTVFGARYLVENGLANPEMLAIRGGSAGGYTTLAALTFRDTFKAGASHYGIGDLEALARDTHKFESRYLDSMIGRYPEDIDIYKARSPINHVEQLACPVIFFQGLEDKVVPPNQAEAMVEALEKRGVPVAYVPFEGEQHGFRKAENIKRALDLELYFYARVFGFSIADQVEPIRIRNLP